MFTWKRMGVDRLLPKNSSGNKISVIIPVRNEEENILKLLQDLLNQDLSPKHFEVLIINDNSTDNTEKLVKEFIANYSLQHFTLLNLELEGVQNSYKKKAIEFGISRASGNIIVGTDGDCRVGKFWLTTIYEHMQDTEIVLLSSPVCLEEDRSVFTQLQSMEFAGLIGSGAASIQLGFPYTCNGANIAYRKDAFEKLKGFEGVDHLASGDDEFLLHKVVKQYPGKVKFLKNKEAIVTTKAMPTLKAFLSQRKRWSGKWKSYKLARVKVLAVFFFLFHFFLFYACILSLAGKYSVELFIAQILLKLAVEYGFLRSVHQFFDKKMKVLIFFFLQFLYPVYISFFGLVANFGGYEWKGRKVN